MSERAGAGRGAWLVANGAIAMVVLLALAGAFVVIRTLPPAVPMAPSTDSAAAAPANGGAQPLRLEIPRLGVDVAMVDVGLLGDGALEVPVASSAGWYRAGPVPGEHGPAVVVGHVDSPAGPGVFARLGELRRGDRVLVRGHGAFSAFTVDRLERTPKDRLPVDRIWAASGLPQLRLVTCGGPVDWSGYRDNVIVYASVAL